MKILVDLTEQHPAKMSDDQEWAKSFKDQIILWDNV